MGIATKHIGLADKFAVSASTVCAVHCIGLPFLLSVFPAIGTTFSVRSLFMFGYSGHSYL